MIAQKLDAAEKRSHKRTSNWERGEDECGEKKQEADKEDTYILVHTTQ
jgi:hypothetical protein